MTYSKNIISIKSNLWLKIVNQNGTLDQTKAYSASIMSYLQEIYTFPHLYKNIY